MSSNSNATHPRAPSRAVRSWTTALAACFCALSFAAGARADQESCVAAHEQGQELRIQGRLRAAGERFAQCAQNCPKLISQDCKSLLEQVTESVPSVVFAISDEQGADLPGARLFANDELLSGQSDGRALPLDPGSYQIRVEAQGYATLERKLTVYAGEKQRVLRLQLARAQVSQPTATAAPSADASSAKAEPSTKVPVATYALGGAALAVAGTAVALGVMGKGDLDDLKRCPGECDDIKKRGKRLYIAADVGFGVAGGLAIAATWVYVAKLLGEKRSTAQASHVTPWLGARSSGIALHTRF